MNELPPRQNRCAVRYHVKQGALAVHGSIIGQIIDISRSGIAFEYAPLALEKTNPAPLRIVLHHDHIPFDVAIASQEVYDRPLPRDKSASFLKVRRRGMAFAEMSSSQASALEYFIDNHTLGPI